MQNSDQPDTVPVQGLLAELANQHSLTPKAVVKYHPNPLTITGKPSTVLMRGGRPAERAASRMGVRTNV